MVILVSFFLLAGAFFALVAAIGIIRMPDLYCQLHAATKAGAFGACLILIALGLAAPTPRTWLQGAMIIGFFYLTAPLAALMVGKLGLLQGIKLWKPKEAKARKPSTKENS